MECFCIKYANKIGGMVESQTMKKLNLSVPVDETIDLFTALIKLITISLKHHITNKVIVRYCKNPIVNLQLDKPSDKKVVVKEKLPMSDINIIWLAQQFAFADLPCGLGRVSTTRRGLCLGAEKTRSQKMLVNCAREAPQRPVVLVQDALLGAFALTKLYSAFTISTSFREKTPRNCTPHRNNATPRPL
jgi:hypothetical protein